MKQSILGLEGFDIYEVSPDQWVLDTKVGNIHCGTFVQVVTIAAMKYDFSLNEIEIAVQEMISKGHNAAHFGSGRTFIFSFTKDFQFSKTAS